MRDMDIEYKNGIRRLLDEYSPIIRTEIEEGLKWRNKIESHTLSDDDNKNILRDIYRQLLVQGRSAKGVDAQVAKDEKRFGELNFENLKKNLSILAMSARKVHKLKAVLDYIETTSVSGWILGLHSYDVPGNASMGPKSDDDFLKNHGFYEHVPVDRHTQRFLFRSGLLQWYLKNNQKEDILTLFGNEYLKKYALFQRCLTEVCKEIGEGIEFSSSLGRLSLPKNPGIIDIAIWRHCGEDEKYGCRNICGNQPKCHKCVFREACMHDRNLHNPIKASDK